MNMTTDRINQFIQEFKGNGIIPGKVSDGYHTIDELYEHRFQLWITVCRLSEDMTKIGISNTEVFKTKTHSNGEVWDGWFLLGIINYNNREGEEIEEQLTYHLPMKYWDDCDFEEKKIAPEWDGHSSTDVLQRLENL